MKYSMEEQPTAAMLVQWLINSRAQKYTRVTGREELKNMRGRPRRVTEEKGTMSEMGQPHSEMQSITSIDIDELKNMRRRTKMFSSNNNPGL